MRLSFSCSYRQSLGSIGLRYVILDVGQAGYTLGATFENFRKARQHHNALRLALSPVRPTLKPALSTAHSKHPTSSDKMATSFRDLLGIRPGTAATHDSALIIIDAQNEYARGQLKVTNAESSGKAIASLLEKYRAAGGKIVHIMHQTPEGAPIFTPGTELANEFSNVAAKVSLLNIDGVWVQAD